MLQHRRQRYHEELLRVERQQQQSSVEIGAMAREMQALREANAAGATSITQAAQSTQSTQPAGSTGSSRSTEWAQPAAIGQGSSLLNLDEPTTGQTTHLLAHRRLDSTIVPPLGLGPFPAYVTPQSSSIGSPHRTPTNPLSRSMPASRRNSEHHEPDDSDSEEVIYRRVPTQ